MMTKYQYTGSEYTLVRTVKNGGKIKVWSGECFESDLPESSFRVFFRKVATDEVVSIKNRNKEEVTKEITEVSIRGNLIKQYIEKFGKRPGPKWTDDQILSKLAE